MKNLMLALKILLVMAFGIGLSACSTPLNQHGVDNKTAVTELIAAANDAGLIDRKAEPKRGCEVPFDCSPTQEFGTTMTITDKSMSTAEGCQNFLDFAKAVGASRFESTMGNTLADGDPRKIAEKVLLEQCMSDLVSGLENPDFSVLDLIEGMSVSVSGSYTTSTGASVPYRIQFNRYETKEKRFGFLLYISANSDEFAAVE